MWNPFRSKPKSVKPPTAQQRLDEYWKKEDAKQRELLENLAIAPPWDIVNPWQTMFNGLRLLFPITTWRFDRTGNSVLFLTEAQLSWIRMVARWLYETNPYAQGVILTLADYTLGTGFDPYCCSKKYGNASKSLLQLCDKYLHDVLTKNKWKRRERDLFIRTERDGDCFVRFFPQDDGITKLRVVEPDQVRNPYSHGPEDSFGIHTDPTDFEDVKSYEIWYDMEASHKEMIPEHEMVHWINHFETSVFTKRGISSFWVMGSVFDDAIKLLRAGSVGESVRQSIAYIRTWALANATTIQNLQSQNTDYQLPKWDVPSSLITQKPFENVTQVEPGEVHDVPKEMEVHPPPIGNGENFQLALHVTLRAAAVKWRIPEWAVHGTTDGNFANSLVRESPMVKAREYDQFLFLERFKDVWNKILEIGADQGILPQDVCEHVEVTAEPVPIATRNFLEETQLNEILRNNGILSARTWTQRAKLDWDEERENIEKEKAEGILPPAEREQQMGNQHEEHMAEREYQRETNRGNL